VGNWKNDCAAKREKKRVMEVNVKVGLTKTKSKKSY